MISRKERTLSVRNQVNEEWSFYWFNNVILANLRAEHLIKNVNTDVIWIGITLNPNTTLELIKYYVNLPWDDYLISKNLIKSIDFIKENPDFPFLNWSILSYNENISLKDIDDNPQFPWDYKNMSCRTDLTHEFVKKNIDKNWDYMMLSEREDLWDDINKNAQNYCVYSAIHNPRITLEFIERHLDLYLQQDWYLNEIARMKIVTQEFIEKHIEIFKKTSIALNPNVTPEFLKKHNFDIVHDMYISSVYSEYNPSVTPEMVRKHPDVLWNWDKLSARENFCPRENPDFPWDWGSYTKNPKFKFENVPEQHLNKLNWDTISLHHKLTIEQINIYSDYIRWNHFTINPHVTMKFVTDHPEFPWVHKNLWLNVNCTINIINHYKNEIWPISPIYNLSLAFDKEVFIVNKYKRHLAAYRIQQQWDLARTDPNYSLCEKKLERDFELYVS